MILRAVKNMVNAGKAKRAYFAKLAEFEERIAEARAKHQAVRQIEAERRAFVHGCLRGAK